MKKILYITAKIVPYRTLFFNQWNQYCDLTVAYEVDNSGARDSKWTKSEPVRHKHLFLPKQTYPIGIILAAYQIIKLARKDWDMIIMGCFNSRAESLAMCYLKLRGIPFVINLDGESYFEGKSFKQRLKRLIANTSNTFLVAGEQSAINLKKYVKSSSVIVPYYFSSMTSASLEVNARNPTKRGSKVLVIGQYFDYKGMDVALRAAKLDVTIAYQFVGMGIRQPAFLKKYDCAKLPNVEFIPFLQKEALFEQLQKCCCLVLPSRQECWGLVVNEAASLGTPIVSTWGSGAAVEFLSNQYPHYLAEPDNSHSLLNCIKLCMRTDNESYSAYLVEKGKKYNIERMVSVHQELLNRMA